MALKIPYATNIEADVYLANDVDWIALTEEQKTAHLVNGRYFMDSAYTCTELPDEDNDGLPDDIPEEYKYANSLLAQIDMTSGLFNVDDTAGSPVVSKRVKAGSVESETSYAGQFSASTKLNAIDPYPQITSLLSGYCYINKSSSTKSVSLLRA